MESGKNNQEEVKYLSALSSLASEPKKLIDIAWLNEVSALLSTPIISLPPFVVRALHQGCLCLIGSDMTMDDQTKIIVTMSYLEDTYPHYFDFN